MGQHIADSLTRCTYMHNVAEGMVLYLNQYIVHNDVKPKNIAISNKTAVLIDLGMATFVKDGEAACPGGTDGYQPIECMALPLHGAEPYRTSCASDMYALGITIVEVVVTIDCLPVLAALCPDLPELLRSMLSLDPSARPTAPEVAVKLQAAVGSLQCAVAHSAASVPCVQMVKENKDSDAYGRWLELWDLQRFVTLRKEMVGRVGSVSFLESFLEGMDDYLEVWDAVGCGEELFPYVKSLVWQRVKDVEVSTQLLHDLDAAFSSMEAE